MARSEFDLIAAIRERLPRDGDRVLVGSGDDAAVVRAAGSHSVVSVDTTVDGVHARLDLGEPVAAAQAFGWRALTTALSDLAAMGVDLSAGSEAYCALTLPKGVPDDLALALTQGYGDAARRYGVSAVGGDITAGPVVTMSVTVVGWGEPGALLTRRGSRPGDLIGLTGAVGAAGAGLTLLLGQVDPGTLPASDVSRLLAAHLRPEPEVARGAALRAAGATAAIDLSDGLVQDASHVAQASGVTLRLDTDRIPLAPGVETVALQLGEDPVRFASRAGEDFALLVTVPPRRRAAAEAAGVAHWIGTVEAGAAAVNAGSARPGAGEDEPVGHDHRR